MFNTINGLPVHALAVHAVVVLVPLSALLGVLFVVPRLRSWSRLPLPLVALAAVVATFVARQSGQALRNVGGQFAGGLGGEVLDLVNRHQQLANQLFYIVIGYAVLAVAAAFLAGRPRGRAADSASRGALTVGLSALLVIGAVVVGVWTYRVGDSGARAVWNPTGTISYAPAAGAGSQ